MNTGEGESSNKQDIKKRPRYYTLFSPRLHPSTNTLNTFNLDVWKQLHGQRPMQQFALLEPTHFVYC